jgi:hypothetical protein
MFKPTTEQVRNAYVRGTVPGNPAEFDTWLSEELARAWERGRYAEAALWDAGTLEPENPYTWTGQ